MDESVNRTTNNEQKHNGFSLTEVLLAVGTIAVGMLFIAGVFPVAIHFTTIASERTVAAVVADEAFAKIRLYGVIADFNSWPVPPAVACVDFRDVANGVINLDEFSYPSDPNRDISDKQFYWSALCRLPEGNYLTNDPNRLVQVTVFVCRKVGRGSMYQGMPGDRPVPVSVGVVAIVAPDTLQIAQPEFIGDGYTIVDNVSGQIYRVLERDAVVPDRIILDRPWQGSDIGSVWVIPPPTSGGRNPCIAVYQRVIRF
jgi:type II secretory pathway pseudopilin PulG